MKVFVLSFDSPRYPEDDRIIGVYATEEAAKAVIQSEIEFDRRAYPQHPQRYQQSPLYYDIDEQEVQS
jgi:hypothetical protein